MMGNYMDLLYIIKDQMSVDDSVIKNAFRYECVAGLVYLYFYGILQQSKTMQHRGKLKRYIE